MLTKIRRIINEVKRGVGNIIYFLPVIWKFRDWDFGYSYDVFYHALERLQHGLHTSKYRDNFEQVQEIDRVQTYYYLFKEAPTEDIRNYYWKRYHDTLRVCAQEWWD